MRAGCDSVHRSRWKTQDMQSVDLAGVQGVRWLPDSPSGIAFLVLAGSRGRVDSARAELLARHGVIVRVDPLVRRSGSEHRSVGRPLETFLERVADLAHTADRVLVLGTLFGAEAALLTAFTVRTSTTWSRSHLPMCSGRESDPTRASPRIGARTARHFRTWKSRTAGSPTPIRPPSWACTRSPVVGFLTRLPLRPSRSSASIEYSSWQEEMTRYGHRLRWRKRSRRGVGSTTWRRHSLSALKPDIAPCCRASP